jgi:hypothetical protein
MRRRPQQVSLSLTAAISVVAGLTTATVGLTALTGSAAWADSTAALPLSQYAHMLVDTAHQHLFFSQGVGSTNILVTDLSGTPVTTITDEQGATGLALSSDGSTLYAGSNLFDAGTIYRIDNWKDPANAKVAPLVALGIGFPETLAVRGDVFYRMSDTGGGPSMMRKARCR